MDKSRGSFWSKWDLHVHTPASIVQQYGGNKEEIWEDFITDLESLPEEYKVIGINDYYFLDGYKKILEYKEAGRLENIELLLPVIELRLNNFGGTTSHLSKVNYHVIFADSSILDPETIEAQFINSLQSDFQLTPKYEISGSDINWKGIITKESLKNLGESIINSVPMKERKHYGSPLKEGFNNLTLNIKDINDALNSSYFKNKYVTAVGKTEWANIKWMDGSIADKKTIINKSDIVFISAENKRNYDKNKEELKKSEVNDKLLDCSDAHYFSNSEEKDRIGNCSTWIKAYPSFLGLKRSIKYFDQRIFVGNKPQLVKNLNSKPSHYIENVKITKNNDSEAVDKWFDVDLPLNPGLVSIIGNKGSGKSAFSEIIGLLGDSKLKNDFSFLTKDRFYSLPDNLGKSFDAEIEWRDGSIDKYNLFDEAEVAEKNKLRIIPQKYLDSICTELKKSEKTDFDKELESIIYSHIPKENIMGGEETLADILERKTRAINSKKNRVISKIEEINEQIIDKEKMTTAEYKNDLKDKYYSRRREWYELKNNEPEILSEPEQDDPERKKILEKIEKLKFEKNHLEDCKERLKNKKAEEERKIDDLSSLKEELKTLEEDQNDILEKFNEVIKDFSINDLITKLDIDWAKIDEKIKNKKDELSKYKEFFSEDEERNFTIVESELNKKIADLELKLTKEEETYQNSLESHEEWENQVNNILNIDDSDSVICLRNKYYSLSQIPDEIKKLEEERNDKIAELHKLLIEETNIYDELYSPLQQFMQNQNQPIPDDFKLNVSTTIIDEKFADVFLEKYINRSKSGSFYGQSESQKIIDELIAQNNLNETDDLISLVENINKLLHENKANDEKMEVESQLKTGIEKKELYDFIFSLEWMSIRFNLKFNGTDLHKLSPGEKGVLLLAFFLLAEKDTSPIIIDQPEDNLDNNTVFKILVDCFKIAKNRRQVIIVTHNPNLAVVCDSDQIVRASMDKSGSNEITYTSGPIEDKEVVGMIVDILEGTQPAFNSRAITYEDLFVE
jgi:ABC-type lipoprotein export system ATPase subunit